MDKQTLRAHKEWFLSLSPPGPGTLQGVYQAEFVGPGWLQRLAGPALSLVSLKNWWGKVFDGPDRAENLVARGEGLLRTMPIRVDRVPSRLDGRPGVTLVYPRGSPFPWPWIVDELRQVEEGQILGVTLAAIPGLDRLALPFLLRRRRDLDGL
jgi:hypothetical protein